jgi:DNA-binding MarR family transcriptional regulator
MPTDPAVKSAHAAPKKKSARSRASIRRTAEGPVLDLERYVPGLFTLVTSRLSGGASAAYLSLYAVGIETWRVMVMLAIEGRVTANRIVKLLDADKGAVSRTFKTMHEQGLLAFEPDESDRRLRHARMTARGRALHDRILRLALIREEAALSILSDDEVATLRGLLGRLYAHLPQVEAATATFSRTERQSLGMAADAKALRRRGVQRKP